MTAKDTVRHTSTIRRVETRAASTFGLTLGELRLFLQDCEAAEIPDKASVHVGGVSLLKTVVEERTYWVRRIEAEEYVQ